MSDKYIIKNCPCRMELHENDCFGHTGYYNCCACTDCLLKQIVEKCKKIIFLNGGVDFTDVDMYKHAVGENFVAKQILDLLDIQEVE